MTASAASLFPWQVCFVVDDVRAAAVESSRRFGWGPFLTFTTSFDEMASPGAVEKRVTDVALGMAGAVQVELLHVHQGLDCIAAYQKRYGRGFQHLGIGCRSREAALERLESLGARLDHRNEYAGIKIGFVDVPTGPAMFELLELTTKQAGPSGEEIPHEADLPVVELDRATIVTDDMEGSLAFYSRAFGWEHVDATVQTLRHGENKVRLPRAIGRAGLLEIELVEALAGSHDPYSTHRGRGEHGLVHAGAAVSKSDGGSSAYEWLEAGESFDLCDWSAGEGTLQLRAP